MEQKLYTFIEQYARDKQLDNTLLALSASRDLLLGTVRRSKEFDREGILHLSYFEHCLAAARLLIDIKVPLCHEEEDLLLAATVCHDIPGSVDLPLHGEELTVNYHLDPRVYEITHIITTPYFNSEEEKTAFYRRLRSNKLGLLLTLADRAEQVEKLHNLSIVEAMDYVEKMRSYYLPLCYYALEHYPDVQSSVNVLMGKIRSLIDVTDIISRRYRERERIYNNELLSLKEENARLKGLFSAR